MNDFITAEMLATFAGMVACINLIVQFSKKPIKDKFGDGAVRLYSFIISLVLSFIFLDMGHGVQAIALHLVNAILLATSTTGSYEIIADPKALKTK